jgi:hypothetical protein
LIAEAKKGLILIELRRLSAVSKCGTATVGRAMLARAG